MMNPSRSTTPFNKYRLERLVDGEWYEYGTYSRSDHDIKALAEACAEFGEAGYSFERDLRIMEVMA